MGITETLLFYLVIGAAVAVAAWAREQPRSLSERIARAASAVLFWPIHLPLLISPIPEATVTPKEDEPAAPDEIAVQIDAVEAELDTALADMGGWADAALAHQKPRIAELRAAWTRQAERIRQMDSILSRAPNETVNAGPGAGNRVESSVQRRRENVTRLSALRRQTHEELTVTLARVAELVSLIHLARFTGASPSRAEELVQEIAASIEGLSEVAAWRESEAPAMLAGVGMSHSDTLERCTVD